VNERHAVSYGGEPQAKDARSAATRRIKDRART